MGMGMRNIRISEYAKVLITCGSKSKPARDNGVLLQRYASSFGCMGMIVQGAMNNKDGKKKKEQKQEYPRGRVGAPPTIRSTSPL